MVSAADRIHATDNDSTRRVLRFERITLKDPPVHCARAVGKIEGNCRQAVFLSKTALEDIRTLSPKDFYAEARPLNI